MRTTVLTLLLAALTPASWAQDGLLIPQPQILDVEALDGTEHRLFVSLPAAYEAETERLFPVLYLLDGNTKFAMVAQTYGYFDTFGGLEPVVIVGIGYPTDQWSDVLARRARDYTPTRSAAVEAWMSDAVGIDGVETGGAAAFLRLLEAEIIPLIESTYRVDGRRVIAGFSYGGLFAAYALFAEPRLFTGYLIGSPSLGWDDGAFYTLDAVRATPTDPVGARVFLSAGELEPATSQHTARLAELLQARHSEDLDVQTHFFAGETHLSVIPATMSRGLRALFTVP